MSQNNKTAIAEAIEQFSADELFARLLQLGDPRVEDYNLILNTDSYKFFHANFYKVIDIIGAFSYIEARIKDMETVFFGLQMNLRKYMRQVTMAHVEEAREYCASHFGRDDAFPYEDWKIIVEEYDGWLPVEISAVPEGTVLPSGNMMVKVVSKDDRLAWLAPYVETMLLRGIWYPVTVASKSRRIKRILKRYLEKTVDGGPEVINALLKYMLHDFGFRGVSSKESAGIGGLAHLVNFYGTDTTEANLYGRKYYNIDMAGISVAATEHSIMTVLGKDGELETLRKVIETYGKPGFIVSVVMDGYDIFRATDYICNELKDLIIEKGIKFVIRPDSGDASEIIPILMDKVAGGFGYTINSKGYKVVNPIVGILQGDGLSEDEDFIKILEAVIAKGYSVQTLVFGMGGGLLQAVTRDDLKFAQKTCAAEIDGKGWIDVFKDPITDPGKKSKKGKLMLINQKDVGFRTVNEAEGKAAIGFGHAVDATRVYYDTGWFAEDQDFDEIRARAEVA